MSGLSKLFSAKVALFGVIVLWLLMAYLDPKKEEFTDSRSRVIGFDIY